MIWLIENNKFKSIKSNQLNFNPLKQNLVNIYNTLILVYNKPNILEKLFYTISLSIKHKRPSLYI